MPFKKLKYARAALLVGAVALGAPATASAAPCPPVNNLTKAFADLGDLNDYFIAPGGDFEVGSAPWRFSERVNFVSGTTNALAGPRAVRFASTGRATSPEMCVDGTYTHLRLFVHSPSGDGFVRIEARYIDGDDDDDKVTRLLGVVPAAEYTTWQATPFIPLASRLGLDFDERLTVRLRITASSDVRIDGVAVDPYRR